MEVASTSRRIRSEGRLATSLPLLLLLLLLCLCRLTGAAPGDAPDDHIIGTEMDDLDGQFNLGLGVEVSEHADTHHQPPEQPLVTHDPPDEHTPAVTPAHSARTAAFAAMHPIDSDHVFPTAFDTRHPELAGDLIHPKPMKEGRPADHQPPADSTPAAAHVGISQHEGPLPEEHTSAVDHIVGTEVDDLDSQFDLGLGVEVSEHSEHHEQPDPTHDADTHATTTTTTATPIDHDASAHAHDAPPLAEDHPSLVHPLHVVEEDEEEQEEEEEHDATTTHGAHKPHPARHPSKPSSTAVPKPPPVGPGAPLFQTLKEKGTRLFDRGTNLVRQRDYSSLEVTVLVLAILVTIALCCVAISLHCRCGSTVLACLARVVPAICPCTARCFVGTKQRYGVDEIQLKRTLYYDNANMGEDDNL